jgi:DnaJ-class molecular chaperone
MPLALKEELKKMRKMTSASQRKKFFMQLCFQWHPDKNPENMAFATKVFQMLQEKKKTLLGS